MRVGAAFYAHLTFTLTKNLTNIHRGAVFFVNETRVATCGMNEPDNTPIMGDLLDNIVGFI